MAMVKVINTETDEVEAEFHGTAQDARDAAAGWLNAAAEGIEYKIVEHAYAPGEARYDPLEGEEA